MTGQNPTVCGKIKISFDIKTFETLIKIDKILDHLKNSNEDDYSAINAVLMKIPNKLDNLKSALSSIAEVGTKNNYDIKWLMSGKVELIKIFSVIDLLEFNMNILLNELENYDANKTEAILDTLTVICNHNMSIKTMTYPLKIRLNIINHFNEIRNEVLGSIYSELVQCIQELEDLNSNKDMLHISDTLKDFSLNTLLQKKREHEATHRSLTLDGFIIISKADNLVYSKYTNLHVGLSPIAQSLKIIPTALNDFHHSSKHYYKSLVKKCVLIYDDIMRLYRKYTDNLRKFKSEYISERNDLICEKIFAEIDINNKQPKKVLENIISILKPIEQSFGLSGQYQKLLKDVEYKLNCIQLEENIFKTPLSQTKNIVSRRSFSNPLTDTLNMKPILYEASIKNDQDFKIFNTPKLFDQAVFSDENNEIIRKIKLEIDFKRNDESNGSTPTSDQSINSNSSSPETMRVKNIFDSPDPFVTPNSRNFQKSKLPISTPLTTPRITPTKKYVMLPIDEEPKIINDWNSRVFIQQKPLLRYELSTLIKEEHDSEEDNDSSDNSPNDGITSGSSGSNCSPPVSRIPLPSRPESRMNLLRSASRLDLDRGCQIPSISRSDSRLTNMATSISSKLGTPSPVITAGSKMVSNYRFSSRSTSVLTHRELKPQGTQSQIGRLSQRHHGLSVIKTRGMSALESRTSFNGSRVTTL